MGLLVAVPCCLIHPHRASTRFDHWFHARPFMIGLELTPLAYNVLVGQSLVSLRWPSSGLWPVRQWAVLF